MTASTIPATPPELAAAAGPALGTVFPPADGLVVTGCLVLHGGAAS